MKTKPCFSCVSRAPAPSTHAPPPSSQRQKEEKQKTIRPRARLVHSNRYHASVCPCVPGKPVPADDPALDVWMCVAPPRIPRPFLGPTDRSRGGALSIKIPPPQRRPAPSSSDRPRNENEIPAEPSFLVTKDATVNLYRAIAISPALPSLIISKNNKNKNNDKHEHTHTKNTPSLRSISLSRTGFVLIQKGGTTTRGG